MSKAEQFTELTNLVDVDPFALLGVSVSADEKRIAKRYRHVAKQLHPDAITSLSTSADSSEARDNSTSADSEAIENQHIDASTAAQVIARIVNPSYQKLKHEKTRQETLANLRFRVRRLVRTEKLVPTFPSAQALATVADDQVDIFYEQALSRLASGQFQNLTGLHAFSLEIGQLNLVFLRRKMDDIIIRPKRAGLLTTAVTPTAAGPASIGRVGRPPSPAGELTQRANSNLAAENTVGDTAGDVGEPPAINYAKKHTSRAKTYLVKKNYEMAVQELREAIKITPQDPELHSMIGQVYYKQKLSGMAKTHFRQALKLKPTHKIAQKYSKLLGISEAVETRRPTPAESQTAPKKPWLGRLLNR